MPAKRAAREQGASKKRTASKKDGATKPAATTKPSAVGLDAALGALRAKATKRTRDGMARFGIPSDHAWGVTVADIRKIAKDVGRNHDLAARLWATGVYEARLLAAFVDEPERVSVVQMDRWCRDFDNWAVCDTVCFHLFDRTPHALSRVTKWAKSDDEFVKRAAFALLASVGLHAKTADDASLTACLPLIERAADDERNFVKKGVSWALRVVGRRSPDLHEAAVEVARRLVDGPGPAARWVGKDALRELTSAAVLRRLAKLPRTTSVTSRSSPKRRSSSGTLRRRR